jgi:hypothetical protein
MNQISKRSLVAVATLAIIAGGTVVARASWVVPASMVTEARTAAMPEGAAPSVAKQRGNVLVTWSAQEIVPGVRIQKYVVTAHSADNPPAADVVRTVAATSADTQSATFSGAEVMSGKWYWTLVPKFEQWIGDESKKSEKLTVVGAQETNSLGVKTPSDAAMASGTATVTAPDDTAASIPVSPPAPSPSPDEDAVAKPPTTTETLPADPSPTTTPSTEPVAPASATSATVAE